MANNRFKLKTVFGKIAFKMESPLRITFCARPSDPPLVLYYNEQKYNVVVEDVSFCRDSDLAAWRQCGRAVRHFYIGKQEVTVHSAVIHKLQAGLRAAAESWLVHHEETARLSSYIRAVVALEKHERTLAQLIQQDKKRTSKCEERVGRGVDLFETRLHTLKRCIADAMKEAKRLYVLLRSSSSPTTAKVLQAYPCDPEVRKEATLVARREALLFVTETE